MRKIFYAFKISPLLSSCLKLRIPILLLFTQLLLQNSELPTNISFLSHPSVCQGQTLSSSLFRLWDPALLWDAQKGAALGSSEALDALPHWLSRLRGH